MDFVRYEPTSTPHDWMIVWITYNDHNYGIKFTEEHAQHPMGIVAVMNDTHQLCLSWIEAAAVCAHIRKCMFDLRNAREAAKQAEAQSQLPIFPTNSQLMSGVKPR